MADQKVLDQIQTVVDQSAPAGHPYRDGAEEAKNAFLDKAATKEGRESLIKDYDQLSGPNRKQSDTVVNPEVKAYDAETTQAYKDAAKIGTGNTLLAQMNEPSGREAVSHLAEQRAKEQGKPYEAPGKNEPWASDKTTDDLRPSRNVPSEIDQQANPFDKNGSEIDLNADPFKQKGAAIKADADPFAIAGGPTAKGEDPFEIGGAQNKSPDQVRNLMSDIDKGVIADSKRGLDSGASKKRDDGIEI